MDLRFVATFGATVGGIAVAVVSVAGLIGAVVPGDTRRAPTAPPQLFVNSTLDSVVRLPAPLLAEAAPAAEPVEEPLAIAAAPPRPEIAPRSPDDLVLNRLGPKPENPLSARPAKVNLAALPDAGKAAGPVRPEASTVAPAPIPQRAQPDKRLEGVLTGAEIRRIKVALRLTPEQERYWPPVEALLQEISTQQMSLVQAGRQPNEAFGIGMKLRAYSATKPLIAVLQEDQKAEVRRRARAMGFDAVASAI